MSLNNLLTLSGCLFCLGLYGLLTSTNLVRALICLEVVLNAVNLNFMSFSAFLDNEEVKGQVFTLFVIAIAAAESAIGLAILLTMYRNRKSIEMNGLNLLKW
uniref:NAD(P)H-quinone oxidoreductase subunit 4L, chloroplastic n=1 Tax=Entransia fimbriata TaxID=130991 RepID=A0A191T4N9_9VIRI|nr:subunit 4L of NADH-plastoquinone oxidoreductase [Entransia fimbriata]YP_009256725.1 subunit 4L of NADH-plastoquinone oxidoreductase [Entransia fimbriata]ANI25361.1 subunit 4L of NADH-plastoquinone oxidoreductase [Entransia fimbriata]ANI25429.1 subunit 4L of NADH-plastoquinone oxidoreductase [Entransia fimbriata]WKT05790.1 subunit 4L of NADH-plastoquinone oxidoreductase [Entransia fimbriata]WKT05791.1 subunit 4L of NADH-plastoquinone oxidoreductase [Entransia fimbriata]WKT05909.1 subunit 4L